MTKIVAKITMEWARDELLMRWRLLRHDWDRQMENWTTDVARVLPLRLRRAVVVDAAVRATQPSVIGGDAYAGPDGLEYKTLWHHAATPHDR